MDEAVELAKALDEFGLAVIRIADRLLARDPRMPILLKRCVRCGKAVAARRSTKAYCGETCRKAAARSRKRERSLS